LDVRLAPPERTVSRFQEVGAAGAEAARRPVPALGGMPGAAAAAFRRPPPPPPLPGRTPLRLRSSRNAMRPLSGIGHPTQGKLFLGGLDESITTRDINDYCSKWCAR
jgi:hypothetical protein